MSPTALLFPGQGSHVPDMRELVADELPALLDACLELVGEDPFARVADSTRFAQPAIFCASVAAWSRRGPDLEAPVALAGHSLGEFAALVAAQALSAEAALELVVARGALMAEVGEAAGTGGMLALLRATPEKAESLAAAHGLAVANDNAPGQLVLAGPAAALPAAATDARARGMRALDLGVTGAFHHPSLAPAVAPFAALLDAAPFRPSAVPVVSGLTAEVMVDPPRELADALIGPVRWREVMHALAGLGAQRFVDVGPGEVLARLVARNLPDAVVEAPVVEHA